MYQIHIAADFGNSTWLRYDTVPRSRFRTQDMHQGWIRHDQYPEEAWHVKHRKFRILTEHKKDLDVEWLPEEK